MGCPAAGSQKVNVGVAAPPASGGGRAVSGWAGGCRQTGSPFSRTAAAMRPASQPLPLPSQHAPTCVQLQLIRQRPLPGHQRQLHIIAPEGPALYRVQQRRRGPVLAAVRGVRQHQQRRRRPRCRCVACCCIRPGVASCAAATTVREEQDRAPPPRGVRSARAAAVPQVGARKSLGLGTLQVA